MANETMTLISTVTAGVLGTSNIDFTSIPSTFTDLCLQVSLKTSWATATDRFTLRLNGDSGSNYQSRYLTGNGSTASSGSRTSQAELSIENGITGSTGTANTFGNVSIYIPNYAGSTVKSISSDATAEFNSSSGALAIVAGLWNNTAAINRITLDYFAGFGGNTLIQYSSISLYGILKGSGGATVS